MELLTTTVILLGLFFGPEDEGSLFLQNIN
jgi:hypothetical protein